MLNIFVFIVHNFLKQRFNQEILYFEWSAHLGASTVRQAAALHRRKRNEFEKKDTPTDWKQDASPKHPKLRLIIRRIWYLILRYYILRMTIIMWIIWFWLLLLLLCCKSSSDSSVSKSETISFPTLDVSGPWRGRHTWGFQSRNPSSSFSLFTHRFFGWTSHQYGCHRAVFFMKRAWMWTHHRSQMLCIYIYKCCIWYWWFLSARSLRHEDDAQHRMHRKIRGCTCTGPHYSNNSCRRPQIRCIT